MTNNNLIVIRGAAYNDIKKALKQWIDLYTEDLQDGLIFKLYKNGHGKYIIKADERLDNERFYYLINYLNYPEGIDYKIDIQGYTIGKDENNLKGKNLLIYISPTNKDGDNVFVTTSENENFKVDFGGRITKAGERKNFGLPTDLKFENPELLKINKKKNSEKKEDITQTDPGKSFKLIFFIAIGLLIMSFIISFFDKQGFIKFNFFLGMGLAIWFFSDYEMLRSNKYYIYCLMIAIIFLGYSMVIKQHLNINLQLVDLGAFYPLTLLLIQKPARFIYKFLLNREPVIEKPPATFWDAVYMIVLFLAFAVLQFLF